MSEIVKWTNKQVIMANVLNPRVGAKVCEMIESDRNLYDPASINEKVIVRISFENVKTSRGIKNLLYAMKVWFDGENLLMDLVHVKAFDGWPDEILQEMEESKSNPAE